jgi:ribosomal protein S18 acetylase RimI-like enzyme
VCRVRPATGDDVPGVLDCLRSAFEPYRTDYTPEAFADTTLDVRTVRGRMRSMTVFVAEAGGSVVGTVSVRPGPGPTGHLRGMAVRPEHHGRGIGRALLDRALDSLARAGCTRVTLDSTLPLRRAARFYEKNGFRRSGKVTDFFGMPLREYARDLRPSESS